MSLNLALVITGDAKGAKAAADVTSAAVNKIGVEARQTSSSMAALTAANDQAAIAQARAIQMMAGQAVVGANATRLASHEVTNLTRQFADLGVMLAMGQSPLMTMITQGPQIADIMGNRGIRGALSGVIQGLGAMVTPTTAALAGFMALGYGAGYVLNALYGDVKDVTLSLEEQEDLIARVAKQWGGAAPAIKAYNDELQRTKDLNELIAAQQALIQKQYAEPQARLPDMAVNMGDIQLFLQGLGDQEAKIAAVRREYDELVVKVQKGTATGQDALDVQRELNKGVQASIPQIQEYAQQFADLAIQIDQANENSKKFRSDGGILFGPDGRVSTLNPLNPLDGFNRSPFQTEEEIWQERQRRAAELEENKRLGALVPIPTPAPNRQDALPSAYEFLQTQEQTIAQLRVEMALIGASEQLRNRVLALMDAEIEIRRQGIDVQGQEANSLRANAEAIADAKTELERHADAWASVQSAGENAIDGVIGKLAKGDLTGALQSLAEDLTRFSLEMAVGNPLKNAMLGTNYGTVADVPGILGKLFGGGDGAAEALASTLGQTVGAMSVTAGTVMITGSVVGAPTGGEGGILGAVAKMFSPANQNDASAGGSYGSDLAANIKTLAANIGAKARDVAALMSFESGLNPEIWGGSGGRHYGLIQAGGPERAAYGIQPGGSLAGQFAGIERYFKDRGYQPGMSGLDLYSTVNAGRPGRYNASDAANGGTWGTVADKWNHQMGPHFDRADRLLGGFNESVAKTSANLGTFGNGLGTMGNALSQFPAAPAGGGGGIGGLFSGLFGGGLSSAFSGTKAFAAIQAGGGGLYSEGGWTGPGGKFDPAGIVHKGEYVIDAAATSAIGVHNLDRLRASARHGFAEGGFATGGVFAQGGGGASSAWEPVKIEIHDNAGVQKRVEKRREPNGRMSLKVVIDAIKEDYAEGGFDDLNKALYGQRRAGGTRSRVG